MGPTPLNPGMVTTAVNPPMMTRAIAASQHAGQHRVRHLDRREREEGRYRLKFRRVELHRGYEADVRGDRRIDGRVDRPEPLLNGTDEGRDAIEFGEIGRKRSGLHAGASEFDNALFERCGATRDERDPICLAPEPRGERGAKPAARAEDGNRLLVSHCALQEVVCFADQILSVDHRLRKNAYC